IRDSSWTARESPLDWDLASVYSAGSAGAGTIGDSTGITAAGSFTTTTRISRIAGLSSIAIISIPAGRASIVAPVVAAEALTDMRRFVAEALTGTGPPRIRRRQRIPAP